MMKNLILIMALFLGSLASAQTYNKLYTGATADTVTASQTIYKVVNLDTKQVQTVSVLIHADSVSGTPGATATLYRSLDGVNWVSTGKTATWVTGVDTTFFLTDTSFYGTHCKVEIVGNATTQKQRITATLKSWNSN